MLFPLLPCIEQERVLTTGNSWKPSIPEVLWSSKLGQQGKELDSLEHLKLNMGALTRDRHTTVSWDEVSECKCAYDRIALTISIVMVNGLSLQLLCR